MDVLGIAASGLNMHQAWLNAISDNIANVNDARNPSQKAFQAEYIVANEAVGNNGVEVTGVERGSAQGKLVYDPSNPVANKAGYVRMPDIDLGEQMSDLIMAQRGFEANSSMVQGAEESFQAALQIGKNS